MLAPEISALLDGLHPLEVRVLLAFGERSPAAEAVLLDASGLDASRLSMALGWLLTKEAVRIEREVVTRRGAPAAGGGRGLEPDEVSGAVGALKSLGAIRIVEGGVLEAVPGADVAEFHALQRLIASVREAGARGMGDPAPAANPGRGRWPPKGAARRSRSSRPSCSRTARGGGRPFASTTSGSARRGSTGARDNRTARSPTTRR